MSTLHAFEDMSYQYGWGGYMGRFRQDDRDVTVLTMGPPIDDATGRAGLRDVSAWVCDHTQDIMAFCAAELLDIKNTNWLRPGEPPLPAWQFAIKPRLKRIVRQPNGALEVYFTDGGLFWGHDILVGITPERVLSYATLEG